ncbi:MAG: hypothetical protein COA58_05625 [Bacteroidetes bacterium]|nr:MAG: hypothetical protein COA58_05625 [Bacteroidota bacterium]
MKNLIRPSLVILFCHLIIFASAQYIILPDTSLKKCLVSDPNINTNLDQEIDTLEALNADVISCTSEEVHDLQGVDEFKNIKELILITNKVNDLNLSFASKLEFVSVTDKTSSGQTGLDMIDVSSNLELYGITIVGSDLNEIDLSKNEKLEFVVIDSSNLSDTLNLVQNDLLTYLKCSNANLKSIIFSDIAITKLEQIYCNGNLIDSVRLLDFTALLRVDFSHNLLNSFDIVGLEKVTFVSCIDNNISSLIVSDLDELTELYCDSNQLVHLDLSNNSRLKNLTASNNILVELNVRNGNNKSLILDIKNNPTLDCITVDDPNWSNDRWSNKVDSGVTFNENCLNSIKTETPLEIEIYPNPSRGIVFIKGTNKIEGVTVINSLGQEIKTTRYSWNKFKIDEVPAGMYCMNVHLSDGTSVIKRIVIID